MDLFIAKGVVGTRDMGGDTDFILPLRERVKSGAVLGPEIVAPGPILDDAPPSYPYRHRVTNAQQAREIPHGFKIEGTVPARMLILCAPAGFEHFVLEMSEPAKDLTLPPPAPDIGRLMAVAAKYKIDILGPLPKQPGVST